MKKQAIESALHDWLSALPFTQQAVLLLALRGPDGINKSNSAKAIVYFIRGVVIKPAYNGLENVTHFDPGTFMRIDFEHFTRDAQWFFEDVDFYPHHFLMHLIHAAEIIGYHHPSYVVRALFNEFYEVAADSLHMTPETKEELTARLKK